MKIGLIAGGGQFPRLFTQKALEKGYEVVAVGFPGDTRPDLADQVSHFKWLHLGQVSRLVSYFRSHAVDQAVMMGTIRKTNIFKDIKPDLKALAFIARTGLTHDDTILTAFAELMRAQGVEILASTFLLPELLSPKGCWTQKKPGRAEKKDIHQGWHLARAIGRLDIGQCLVISHGTVLAVEAIDGTDATIARGASLSHGKGAVVIKLSKPGQDLRFDLPASGCDTICTMKDHGATVLVLEAGKSISFDRQAMIDLANQHGISILALTDEDIP
jgi:DUF1009 family protein